MATDDDQRMALDRDEEIDSSSSDSEDGGDKTAAAHEVEVEWLATSREKRSTAGNRMKSMLAIEEPDDELELLFAEDGDDAGFSEVEDGNASDVHMDSSSDDEDAQENGDQEAGEKELERQARENKQAARKRKAQEAIPLKFRKKAKIATEATSPAASKPPPRPKKKSERASWLPTSTDMPTRASKRETTMMSKEQLHHQMVEREAKRLKQVEAMERKAKKMEALRKPPMTQAERLAEAAVTEKRNAKSLNRWEEAEKQREEERRAKLAALNSRTLKGPVITFWSGVGEWVDGKLKHVGKIVIAEEKPLKKKRASVAGTDPRQEVPPQDGSGKAKDTELLDPSTAPTANPPDSKAAGEEVGMPEKLPSAITVKDDKLSDVPAGHPVSAPHTSRGSPTAADRPSQEGRPAETSPAEPQTSTPGAPEAEPPTPDPTEVKAPETKAPETKAPEAKAPDMKSPDLGPYTSSMFAAPAPPPLQQASGMKPPSSSFLAPPPGATQSGLSMPVLGYAPPSLKGDKASNVLAPPMPAQRQSPLSMPQPDNGSPPVPPPPHDRPAQPLTATKPAPKTPAKSKASHAGTTKTKVPTSVVPPPPRPPTPPANGRAARNCIILQNFDENAIKEKAVQTHILFGKEMPKLAKQGPAPRCVITHHPARYRDPKTGLPFHNTHAYKEIQRLRRGDYKWSSLLGVWVGGGSLAATGVPARFLDPSAPAPPKTTEVSKESPVPGTSKSVEGVPSESGQEKPPTPEVSKSAEDAAPGKTGKETQIPDTTKAAGSTLGKTLAELHTPCMGNAVEEVGGGAVLPPIVVPTRENKPLGSRVEGAATIAASVPQLPATTTPRGTPSGSDVTSKPGASTQNMAY